MRNYKDLAEAKPEELALTTALSVFVSAVGKDLQAEVIIPVEVPAAYEGFRQVPDNYEPQDNEIVVRGLTTTFATAHSGTRYDTYNAVVCQCCGELEFTYVRGR